ncbi:hypothetical protein FRB99_000705 [Tulasnella sp. 403]|nr:hypothetical protein FRB99_000705 [Tulasnella sp. 403]
MAPKPSTDDQPIELHPLNQHQTSQFRPREEIKARIAQFRDESGSWWAWITAGWLAILSILLLLFPRLLLFLSSTSQPGETLTPLESYLCTHFAIGLFATAIALITSVNTQLFSMDLLFDASETPQIPAAPPLVRSGAAPPSPSHPLLVPLSLGLCLTSFISYNTQSVGALGIIMFLGCGFTGLWGVWVMMFESTGNYSNKTGADKHTSSWLFGNKASASAQKKLWKQEREREQELFEMRRAQASM